MAGWFELFQLPLDNHVDWWSLAATLMWYAYGNVQADASGSSLVRAQAWLSVTPRTPRRSATVCSSVWSAEGFCAGWSSTRARDRPAVAAVTASRTWREVKS